MHAPAHASVLHPSASAVLRVSLQDGKVHEKCCCCCCCFCGLEAKVLAFTHGSLLRAHTRRAGERNSAKGVYPGSLTVPLCLSSGWISSAEALPLSPRRAASTMRHCSGPGETWTRVGGRYFSLSGSVVSDCAGPLSGGFGVV